MTTNSPTRSNPSGNHGDRWRIQEDGALRCPSCGKVGAVGISARDDDARMPCRHCREWAPVPRLTLTLAEAAAVVEKQRERLERRLTRQVAVLFRRQAQRLKADALVRDIALRSGLSLREAQPLPDDEILSLIIAVWPEVEEHLAVVIARQAIAGARIAGNLTLAHIGYPASFTVGDAVRDRLAGGALTAARGIEDVSRQRVRAILVRGFEQDWTTDRIARAIRTEMRGWGDLAASRSETIARTEMAEAWSSTQYEVLARNGWAARLWLTAEDERVDDGGLSGPCVANGDAGAVAIDSPFPSGDYYPPQHPRCRCSLSPAPGYGPAEGRDPWTGQGGGEFTMPRRR